MGHRSGLQHAGARGKVQKMSRSELEGRLDGDEISAKLLAQDHVKKSISTLVRAQRHTITDAQKERGETLAPWMTRRQAAKDLIDIAHGRPETRHPDDKTAGAGLTVIIEQLTVEAGATERLISSAELAKNVQTVIDVTELPDSVPSPAEGD